MTRRKLSPFRELKKRHRLAAAESMRPVEDYPSKLQAAAHEYQCTGRDIAYELHRAALQGDMFISFGFPRDMPVQVAERYLSKAKYLLKEAGLKHPTAVSPVFDCPPMFD